MKLQTDSLLGDFLNFVLIRTCTDVWYNSVTFHWQMEFNRHSQTHKATEISYPISLTFHGKYTNMKKVKAC
jgi:hypothetical protein